MKSKTPELFDFMVTLLRAFAAQPKLVDAPELHFGGGATVKRAVRAKCPSCGNKSLSVMELSDGQTRIRCFSPYCGPERICGHLGMSAASTGTFSTFVPESPEVRRATLALVRAKTRAWKQRVATKKKARQKKARTATAPATSSRRRGADCA